jgi:hypothetical protein
LGGVVLHATATNVAGIAGITLHRATSALKAA